MNRPSIVVFAYSEPGYTCLKALIEAKANILAVYTHQDDPDEEIWFHSVYDLAKANFTTNVAGCILSMVMKDKYDDAMVWGLLSFGLASTAILAYVGFRILKK